MPFNNSAENGNGGWSRDFYSRPPSSSPKFTPYSSRESSPPFMPSSPTSSSPLSTSPPISLRRTFSSTFSLIPEDRAVDQPIIITQTFPRRCSNEARFIRLIFWWPLFFIGFLQLLYQYLRNNFQRAFVVLMPTFWMSAALCTFHKIINLPLLVVKQVLIRLHTTPEERNRRKRTILISSGSSIQTLHLARNFFSSGSRVVVFDFDGLFPLSKYSTSVSKYYTVPNPMHCSINDYISAVCEIAMMENVTFYLPVCVSNTAYYDALVKPHLDLLGCQSFISGIHELAILDDILETLQKCESAEIPVPTYKVLTNKEDLGNLYDSGWLSGFRNIIMSVGHYGRVERLKFELPLNRRDLRFGFEISEKRPWIVVQDVPGSHYLTCTTIKDSKVLANVTCLVQADTKNLIPEANEEVEKWLKDFVNAIRLQRPVNGHFSFRLVKCMNTGNLLPIGIRVGVSLPYLCHTSAHSKLLWKSCPHFSRQNSGPLVQPKGRYWIHEALFRTVKNPSVDAVSSLIGTVVDKREALFNLWDPLPYCAYYHFQLPIKSVREFLRRRTSQPRPALTRNGTLTLTVH